MKGRKRLDKEEKEIKEGRRRENNEKTREEKVLIKNIKKERKVHEKKGRD